MSNLPPGVSQHDIDLHLDGTNCEDCGRRFIPDSETDVLCRKCGIDPDKEAEDRDERLGLRHGR